MIGVIVTLLLFTVGAGFIVAGVFMLAATGWGFIVLGAFTIVGGLIIARGMAG
jgi:hypothetical protein